MRSDYSKVDLGAGVRGKYLKDYYANSDVVVRDAKATKERKAASPPRGRKRR